MYYPSMSYLMGVSLDAVVRLLHYDLEVTCLKHKNILSKYRGKAVHILPSQTLQWWEPCVLSLACHIDGSVI